MPATDFNFVLPVHVDRMDNFNILGSYTLKNQVIISRLIIRHNIDILPIFPLDHIWKFEFAQLTIERFPAISFDVLVFFVRPLAVQPILEADDVDAAHSACALTRFDQRIVLAIFFFIIILAEANPANFS